MKKRPVIDRAFYNLPHHEMLFKSSSTRMLPMVITTSPLVKTYTLQEFWNLPEPADHSKLELIKGVLYMTPPPDYPHNDASANLTQPYCGSDALRLFRPSLCAARSYLGE